MIPSLLPLSPRLWLAGLAAALLFTAAAPPPLAGQQADNGRVPRPAVFLDCDRCARDHFRTELQWVDWVRLREAADVHIIMTRQSTGAGGREYRLDFIGTGDFEHQEQLVFRSSPTDTDQEVLDGIVHTLGVGLLHFGTAHGFEKLASVTADDEAALDPTARVVGGDAVEDPWDFWVFRLRGGAELYGEESYRNAKMEGDFRASRVTPDWKIHFRGRVEHRRRETELRDSTFVDKRVDWNVNELIAYALSDHWSLGIQGEVGKATAYNQRFRVEVTPALEYSFFPYEEATRQALTAFYLIGPAHRRYLERTVHGYLRETRWEQSLQLGFWQRQPWGEASIRVRGSHFLHDLDLFSASLEGEFNFRVARGINVYASGDISWVRDQVYLSAQEITDAEALLRLQERYQNFNYELEAGLSIQFGSIYNNVVNNRFNR